RDEREHGSAPDDLESEQRSCPAAAPKHVAGTGRERPRVRGKPRLWREFPRMRTRAGRAPSTTRPPAPANAARGRDLLSPLGKTHGPRAVRDPGGARTAGKRARSAGAGFDVLASGDGV